MPQESARLIKLPIAKAFYDTIFALTRKCKLDSISLSVFHKETEIVIAGDISSPDKVKLEALTSDWFVDFNEWAVVFTTIELAPYVEDGKLLAEATYEQNHMPEGSVEWDREALVAVVSRALNIRPKTNDDGAGTWDISFSTMFKRTIQKPIIGLRITDNSTGRRVKVPRIRRDKVCEAISKYLKKAVVPQLWYASDKGLRDPSCYLVVEDSSLQSLSEFGKVDYELVVRC